jgi:hypothetical protein
MWYGGIDCSRAQLSSMSCANSSEISKQKRSFQRSLNHLSSFWQASCSPTSTLSSPCLKSFAQYPAGGGGDFNLVDEHSGRRVLRKALLGDRASESARRVGQGRPACSPQNDQSATIGRSLLGPKNITITQTESTAPPKASVLD